MRDTVKAKKALLHKKPKEPGLTETDFVSTGITLLNLACYGRVHGGLAKGHVYRLLGRSSSGKTFVGRSILTEAALNSNFKDYELIYDDTERGALMDTEKFFPPLVSRLHPVYSASMVDFYTKISTRLSCNEKLVWIEDSMDSLIPNHETKMGDGKAKINSQEMRKLIDPLHRTKSILVLVSQARMDMNSFFGGDIASGGRALEHYSTLEIWLRKVKTLKRIYKDKKYPIGVLIRAHVSKNRISGVDRTVEFPIYYSVGIADNDANVNFLLSSKHWSKSKGVVTAAEFNFEGTTEKLIQKIEETDSQRELQVLTGKVWREIEQKCLPLRKPRYTTVSPS